MLETFNAAVGKVAVGKVAEASGAQHLDVYEATRTHTDKTRLFMYDGIRVNNEGSRLLALKVLRHLAVK